jgi:hypothetical protein
MNDAPTPPADSLTDAAMLVTHLRRQVARCDSHAAEIQQRAAAFVADTVADAFAEAALLAELDACNAARLMCRVAIPKAEHRVVEFRAAL